MAVATTIENNSTSGEAKVVASPSTDASSKDVTKEKTYWHSFYSKAAIPAVPSQFCVMVSTELNRDETTLVEFGCGNGRDSLYLSSQGFSVFASDLCQEAIRSNNQKGEERKLLAHFSVCDVTDATAVQKLVDVARGNNLGDDHKNVTVYNRFFLHSIDAKQEDLFLKALSKAMKTGDKLYMEFRCEKDEALPKVYGKGHYRRYVHTDRLVAYLKQEELGFDIEYQITGQGMAKYKTEDSFVSRIVAVRK